MSRMLSASLAMLLCLCLADAQAAPPPPSMEVASLATGRFGRLQTVLQKTFLNIRVLSVDMRLGRATAAQLEKLVAGRNYSEPLAQSVARLMYACDDAFVRFQFKLNIDLDSFLGGVRNNLDHAMRAGVLTREQRGSLASSIASTFRVLGERGIRDGDILQYRIRGDAVRTQFFSAQGVKIFDHTDFGAAGRLGQMGGYFAPGTDLREDLLRAVWRR